MNLRPLAIASLLAIGISSTVAAAPQGDFNRIPFRSTRVAKLTPSSSTQENQTRRLNQYPNNSFTGRPNISNEATPKTVPAQTAKFQVQERSDASQSGRVGNKIVIPFGTIQLIDDINLPALELGEISKLNVVEGQYIPANTVVAHIDSKLLDLEEKAQAQSYEIARNRAMEDISITAAQKELGMNTVLYRKNERLYKSRSVSETERDESRFRMDLAALKLEKAKSDQEAAIGEAKLELLRFEIVKTRRGRCELLSKYDAYVIKIHKKVQEFVNVGDDVMQLGRMDVLWAQGTVDASDLDAHDAVNRPVTVSLEMADGKTETFEGKVDYIPLERQGSDQYAVKVRLKNRRASTDNDSWLLRPLARVKMTVHLDRGTIKEPMVGSTQNAVTPLK